MFLLILIGLKLGLSNSFTILEPRANCVIDLDSSSVPTYPPVVVDLNNDWVLPQWSESTGKRVMQFEAGSEAIMSCPGTSFESNKIGDYFILARCESGTRFTILSDADVTLDYQDLGCVDYIVEDTDVIGSCGPENDYSLISIAFDVGVEKKEVLRTCFDSQTSRSVWGYNIIYAEIGNRDTGSSEMPYSFDPDDFFPEFDVNRAYTKLGQRDTLIELLGSEDLANYYVNVESGDVYMARGHLAPRADFLLVSTQRASYHFINTAPQWQCFNGGNWMYLENEVRYLVEDRPLTPLVEVYTGTHGVLELLDVNGNPTEIWLSNIGNEQRLPVPRYYWKVIYHPDSQLGVAIIGVNSPHYEEDELENYRICPQISNHPLITALYDPNSIYKGVTYACTVADAKKVIIDIPDLTVVGVLQ